MTLNPFSNYDLLIAGIVLCIFLSLIVVLLAKILYRNRCAENRKDEKDERRPSYYLSDNNVPAKGIPFEGLVCKKPKDCSAYEALFFVPAEIPTRSGKLVSIRKKYHDRIAKIVQETDQKEVSIFSYIDNVLKHHFETFQDEIVELYNRDNNVDDYLTPKKE